MKILLTLIATIFAFNLSAQYLNWNKKSTSNHNFLLHGEGGMQVFSISFGLAAEYIYEDEEAEDTVHHTFGIKASRTLTSVTHVTNLESAFYISPYLGFQIGKHRHRIEISSGVGFLHENKIFNEPSNSRWLPNVSLGYRNKGTRSIFRFGVGFPYGIYMSFGNRWF